MHSALIAREANPVFRAAVIDRLCDAIRAMFCWLRDLVRECEKFAAIPYGAVCLGAYAARFVVLADTSSGVLIMKFDDLHQELFNLTSAQWQLLLPLLTSPHECGHARLGARPQGLLTRHDVNGDEKAGDLWRLKQYIHPVGRGRGGNGMYFLAPYPRRINVVMGKSVRGEERVAQPLLANG